MLPPLSAVATSQSTLNNTQIQSSAVTSADTLNVVDLSGSTSGTVSSANTSIGNAVSGAVANGALDVESTQSVTAAVGATTTLNVATNAGPQTALTTVAVGDAAQTGSYEGGPLTGVVNQSIAATGGVSAATLINPPASQNTGAQAGDVSTSANAIGNSQAIGVSDTSAVMTVNQTNNGATTAAGDAILNYSPGTTTFSAVAVANTLSASGTGASSQSLALNQTANGQTVSEQDANFGSGQTVSGSATSIANNISVNNGDGALAVTDNQSSTAYAQAQAQVSSYQFGSGQASATGIDNSVMASNAGPSMSLDNTQSNTGTGLTVNAAFTGGAAGGTNYDAGASSTAMGNAVTGACTDCSGGLTVNNSQISGTVVGATSEVDITGANRSVTASATAVGNTATFYVGKASH